MISGRILMRLHKVSPPIRTETPAKIVYGRRHMTIFCVYCVEEALKKKQPIEYFSTRESDAKLCGWHNLKYPKTKDRDAKIKALVTKLAKKIPSNIVIEGAQKAEFKRQFKRFAKERLRTELETFDLDVVDDD